MADFAEERTTTREASPSLALSFTSIVPFAVGRYLLRDGTPYCTECFIPEAQAPSASSSNAESSTATSLRRQPT